ncbi:hypothetical protein QR680_010851 [Steinernema hermaphroditum]|uniref:E1 domain-containing protein n=1 Tax=Steinernema hermaphroditum TaxID=289476 RepID=A0AA39IRQ7_9BILA|nr:hypothetical protein QR680_010851 [Steinernema hermaphroditum]
MLRPLTFLLLVGLGATDFLDDSQTLLSEYSRFVVPVCNGSTYYWRGEKWEKSANENPPDEVCSKKKISNIMITPICEGYPGKLVPVLAGFTSPQKWANVTGEKANGNQSFVTVYECVDRHAPPKMDVSEGCWSDRLVGRGACRTESFWLAKATKECGEAPMNFTVSTQCGKNKYLEIEFVCCTKPTEDPLDSFESHRLVSTSVHHTALSLLKEFAIMNRRFNAIIEDNNANLALLYKNFGGEDSEVLPQPPPFAPMIREYLLTWLVGKTPSVNATMIDNVRLNKEPIMSRRAHWHQVVVQLHQIARERSHNLFQTAFVVATDEEQGKIMRKIKPEHLSQITSLKQFDVEDVVTRFEHTNALDITVFPELKEQIESTWFDYCVNHTWGISEEDLRQILKTPHAHSQILHKYHEIFAGVAKQPPPAEEPITAGPNEIAETAVVVGVVLVTLLLVAIIFAGLIHHECCIAKVKHLKSEKVDHFVRFGRSEDDDRATVEMKSLWQRPIPSAIYCVQYARRLSTKPKSSLHVDTHSKNTKMLICPICKQTARIDRYEHLPNNVILNEIVRDHRSNRISNEIAVNGLVPISMMDEALEELSVDESAVKESHSNAIRRIGKRQQKVQLGYDNLRAKINLLKNGRQVLKAKTSALSSGQFEIEMDKLRKEKAGILAEMEALERWNERYLADITTD